jgi:drug/metabolite transporter (DMT)-like permease
LDAPPRSYASTGRLAVGAFVLMVAVGGGNGVAVRFSNRELAPFVGGGARFAIASVVFFTLMFASRQAWPRGRELVSTFAYGGLGFGVAYAFIYWGLLQVQAGLAQVILALIPLLTFFLALMHRQETFRWRGFVGTIVALAGMAVVFNDRFGIGAAPFLPVLAITAAALSSAEAGVILKSVSRAPLTATNAIAMACGAAILLAFSVAAHESWTLPLQPSTWIALVYLVVVGSVASFALYLYVLRYWTASAASYQFVLLPFVALVLSAWLDHEPLTVALILGGGVVMAGVYLGVSTDSENRLPPTEHPEPRASS